MHDTSNAQIENHNIINPTLAEENCRILNEIYLDTWARDNYEFSTEQRSALEEIALINPLDGGSCVFGSWVMLDLDLEYIIPEEGRLAMHNDLILNIQPEQINIYPNPASHKITVSTTFEGLLEIKDITGKAIAKWSCLIGIAEFNVESLESGLYIYSFIYNGHENINGKLMINR